MAHKSLPLGTSDFQKVIEGNLYYVDKSVLIADVVNGSEITLLPRPRRFGKTLNLSMLSYFFSHSSDYSYLFNGLAIEKNAKAMAHCGQYPVIFLSFKDVKVSGFSECMQKVSSLIQRLFHQHKYLLDSDALDEFEKDKVNRLIQQMADHTELSESILLLSQLLHQHHQKPVVILIDEYDMPINSAYTYDYYDELVGFMRNLLSCAFKDNSSLFKGVMTGILRIARESIFSGLNNIEVCSLTNPRYHQHFGFTEAETEQLLTDYDLTYELDAVRSWYNGYNFGDLTIYNPWSIISLAQNNGELSPYWLNTSDNALVRDLIGKASFSVKQELETLLVDESAVVRKPLNENVVFRDIQHDDDAIWNFLLFCGYLRYSNKQLEDASGIIYANFSIPNKEIRHFYITAILAWFKSGLAPASYDLPMILGYLLKQQFDNFSDAFEQFVEGCFSYFDVSGQASESFYHAFVLGMLVQLQATHRIQSNRESGFGRYDVCVIPNDKSQAGFVFEFKKVNVRRGETLESACEAALAQIAERNYIRELQAQGLQTVHAIAIAFEGKKALVSVRESLCA